MRTPYVIIAVLLVVLVPIGFAGDGGAGKDAATEPSAPLPVIARRVEVLRNLRFTAVPKPVRVTASQARRDGLASLDRGYPEAARRADEALYSRLGLLPEGTDLREVSGSIFGEQVAGYYDPRTKKLRIVEGAATAGRVLDEIVIAHELVHALEDQRIEFDLEAAEASDDGGYAYRALLEGTATEVMYGYLGRHFDSEVALGGLLGASFSAGGTGELPPFVLAGLLFPYQEGQTFVSELYRRGGNGWTLVDLAGKVRPPVSTEQILHPQKWIAAEVPDPVRVPSPGRGWRRLTGGTFGEWQTGQLLAVSGRAHPDAAKGWGGDSYALYRRGDQDVLVMRWRWDSRRDAQEFLPVLRAAIAEMPSRGAVKVRPDGVETTVAFAPGEALAAQLAGARAG